jgi:acetyl esterase/lipase
MKNLNGLAALTAAIMLCGTLAAREPMTMPLYPSGVPDSNGLEGKERPREGDDAGFIFDVSTPEVTVYLPEEGKATGRAVVICPGGGYSGVALLKEGHEPARWLAGRGIAGIVLKYRMPNGHGNIPADDARAAIRMVRDNAAKWGVDPAKVGVMGFSAGGHLAATVSVHHRDGARPDFSILIYPVITFDERFTHRGSRERLAGPQPADETLKYFATDKQVDAATPTAFLALSDDDRTVDPRNSTLYYNAMKEAKVAAELHVYPAGGHGWGGWRESFAFSDEFLTSLGRWLDGLK